MICRFVYVLITYVNINNFGKYRSTTKILNGIKYRPTFFVYIIQLGMIFERDKNDNNRWTRLWLS